MKLRLTSTPGSIAKAPSSKAPGTLRESSTTNAAAASARSVTRAVVAEVGVVAKTRSRGGTSTAFLNGVSQWCDTCFGPGGGFGREGCGGGRAGAGAGLGVRVRVRVQVQVKLRWRLRLRLREAMRDQWR